jgi:hypothetical protein
MGALSDQIGNRMLRQIVLPGTHDSGTYSITPDSPFGMDETGIVKQLEKLVPLKIVKQTMANWSKAQFYDFSGQLKTGIRYLDLRVQFDNGQFNLVHGLVGASLNDLLTQVSDFINQEQSKQEVVLLDFNHFYNMDTANHNTLVTELQNRFGSLLAPYSLGTNVTVNELLNGRYQLIAYYDNAEMVAQYPFLWPGSAINSPWPNVQTTEALKSALDKELPNTGDVFFVLQGILTPDTSTILNSIKGGTASLAEWASEVNPQLVKWIQDDWKDDNLNIIIADFVTEDDSLVNTIIALNQEGK